MQLFSFLAVNDVIEMYLIHVCLLESSTTTSNETKTNINNVWNSGRHFTPQFLYQHAEWTEPSKMLEPDFSFSFLFRVILLP